MEKEEIKKCKEDIVYFVEKYMDLKFPLTDIQKMILKACQGKRARDQKLLMRTTRCGKTFIVVALDKHREFKRTGKFRS